MLLLTFVLLVLVLVGCMWLRHVPTPVIHDPLESTLSDGVSMPFRPNERLKYNISWNGIHAGTLVLTVKEKKKMQEEMTYHFTMTIHTSPFVDIFYKVRTQVDAYADKAMTHSLLFLKKQQEGRRKRNVRVDFDWQKRQARYKNSVEQLDPIPILPGSFDPFSILYYLRLQSFKNNQVLQIPISDGKRCQMSTITVQGKEIVRLGKREIDCFLVEPDMKGIRGVFRKNKNAKLQLWFSDDAQKILVKAKSKVAVGSFIVELVSLNYQD